MATTQTAKNEIYIAPPPPKKKNVDYQLSYKSLFENVFIRMSTEREGRRAGMFDKKQRLISEREAKRKQATKKDFETRLFFFLLVCCCCGFPPKPPP